MSGYYKYFSLLFFLVLYSLQLHAITNIESIRLVDPEDGLKGRIGVSLGGQSGDKEKERRSLNFRLDYTTGKNNVLAIYSSSFEKTNDATSSDEDFGHLRYTRGLTDVLSFEFFGQYQYDRFLLMEKRSLAGGGLRYLIERNERKWSFYCGLGAYHTREEFSDESIPSEHYERYNSYISGGWKITEGVVASNTLYYQPRTDDTSDVYAFNAFQLSIAMAASMKLNLNHLYAYDSEPLLDLAKVRSQYGFEVVWEF